MLDLNIPNESERIYMNAGAGSQSNYQFLADFISPIYTFRTRKTDGCFYSDLEVVLVLIERKLLIRVKRKDPLVLLKIVF